MKLLPTTISALAFLGLFSLAQTALAADGGGGQKQDLVGEAERWLTRAAAGPTVASEPINQGGMAREGTSTAERELAKPVTLGAEQKPLLDFSSPSASIIARDWHGSIRLMGDRTLVLDELRATASNRMVMARLATDARISTFVQLGVGEWRIDPAMFPSARSYSEMAGQVGSGIELRIASRVRVAGEVTYTALYRDLHYTSDEVAPRIVAFAVAIDGRF